ncbi:MAG: hypothetical protein K0R62_306 [Nonomuraea muscovyensis]|nr:hypothetical protein [Nonomuraea muscovyensis]
MSASAQANSARQRSSGWAASRAAIASSDGPAASRARRKAACTSGVNSTNRASSTRVRADLTVATAMRAASSTGQP